MEMSYKNADIYLFINHPSQILAILTKWPFHHFDGFYIQQVNLSSSFNSPMVKLSIVNRTRKSWGLIIYLAPHCE